MDLDAAIAAEMQRRHGVHTLILYGSRARGDATADSDLDVAGFADVDATYRDARRWDGVVLDGFVYPTAVLAAPDPDLLKLRGGRVLLDDRGLAAGLWGALDALVAAGPPVLPEHEARMRRVWAYKMLARIRRDDVEANYRYHWLLYQLLEDHFALRALWYRGPKEALAELRTADPPTFAAFAAALAPGAAADALPALVAVVVGPDPG